VFNHFRIELRNLAGNYLEIGVFNGDSIARLAEEFPNKTIVGIDPFLEDGYTSMHTAKAVGELLDKQQLSTRNFIAGFKNIKFYEMTSKEFAEKLTDELVAELNISGILIDGDHHYEHVHVDAMLALRVIGNKRGHVAFDDINLEDIIQVMDEFRVLGKDRIEQEYRLGDNQYMFILKAVNE
jgi:hypothetical protein